MHSDLSPQSWSQYSVLIRGVIKIEGSKNGPKGFFPKLFLGHLGCSNKWFQAVLSHITTCEFPKSLEKTNVGTKKGAKGVENTSLHK